MENRVIGAAANKNALHASTRSCIHIECPVTNIESVFWSHPHVTGDCGEARRVRFLSADVPCAQDTTEKPFQTHSRKLRVSRIVGKNAATDLKVGQQLQELRNLRINAVRKKI